MRLVGEVWVDVVVVPGVGAVRVGGGRGRVAGAGVVLAWVEREVKVIGIWIKSNLLDRIFTSLSLLTSLSAHSTNYEPRKWCSNCQSP